MAGSIRSIRYRCSSCRGPGRAITGLGLTVWAYEPRGVRRWGERIVLGMVLLYLIVGVLAAENLRYWLERLPANVSAALLHGFAALHTHNPFGVLQYWLETAERSSASIEADVISGGNFHGQPLAFALDFLGIALSALAGISERRLERLVNPALSEGLPPFLAAGAGLNSGFMMAQVAAASLVSENKVLAHPASVDSITTSGNKEDYVSMGMTAALKLKRIVENSRNAMAIEAMAAAQALDFLAPLKTSKRGQAAHAAIRSVCATMDKDRVMYQDFARVADLIASGKVAGALR